MVATEGKIATAPSSELTSVENADYQRLLVNDLLRILTTKEFFGGPRGGNDQLTTEISAYLDYCKTVGLKTEIFTVETDLSCPQSRGTGSPKDSHLVAWGLAIPENFDHLLIENPRSQMYALVAAVLIAKGHFTGESPEVVPDCLHEYSLAVARLAQDFGSLEGFLQKEIGIQMPEPFEITTSSGQVVMF